MKSLKFFLLIPFFFVKLITYSQQEEHSLERIIPPSPTAAALGAYGDVPVSYYTGTSNISIPIYNIQTSGFSLPVSFSYNASSIRVAQDASWVGLGWSLNAGGVITRSIRGLDDLDPIKGYYYAPALPPNDLENYYSGDRGSSIDYYRLANDQEYSTYVHENWEEFYPADHNYFMETNLGLVDAEPDIYYYNFGGYTGSFVMGKQADGSPIIMSEKNNLKFEYIPVGNLNLGKWTVSTPDGTLYSFSTTELTEGYASHTDLPESDLVGLSKFKNTYNNSSVSSWYLDVIQPLKGSQIKFNYTSNSVSLSLVNRQQTRYDRISLNDDDPWLFNYFDLSRQVIHNQYLSSIVFENGRIELLTNSRDDIEGAYSTNLPKRLEYIQIYDKNNALLKEFGLDHSYFNSGTTSTNIYAGLRLKLNAITEYGKSGYPFAKSSPYTFTYYNPNGLPSKYSRKIDSWGYYNPAISNVYINGETYPTQLPHVDSNGRAFVGVERKADETGNYSQSGMLESIIYPTNGSTKFIYEPNRRAINPPDTYVVKSTLAYAYSDDQGAQQLSESFTLSTTTTVKFHLYALATYGTPISGSQIIGYLKNNSGQVLSSFSTSSPDATLSLTSGSYYIEVDPVEPVTDYDIEFRAYTESIEEKNYRISGGNRIKEIKNYDADGIETSYKKFEYTEDGYENGKPTGRDFGFTKQDETRGVYFHKEGKTADMGDVIRHGVWSTSTELYLIRKSAPIFSLGLSDQSGFIGYDNVYVLEGADGTGGFTKYSYYNSAISPPINPYYYYIPGLPIYRDPIFGKLKSVEYLDNNRDLIERHEYFYTEKERTIMKGMKIFVDRPSPFPGYHFEDDGIKFYDNVSKWYALASKVVTKDLYGDVIIAAENYDYDNPDHLQLTNTEITDSKGKLIESRIIYPQDIPDKYSLAGGNITDAEYNAIAGLKQQNRIVPIQTETYQGSVLLSRKRTLYQDFRNGLILPKAVQTSKGTGALKTRIEYHKYDAYGNIEEASKVNAPHTVYIWGYNGQYPIAKIENVASYSSISSSLITAALGASNSDYSSTKEDDFRSALAALRNSLPNAMVSTYTYDLLSGMTSVIGPNGLRTSYGFDNFNRLQFIKDETNKLLQQYKYNYKD